MLLFWYLSLLTTFWLVFHCLTGIWTNSPPPDPTLWCRDTGPHSPGSSSGKPDRLTHQQQIWLSPFSSTAGIPTMSAVTSPRKSQQRRQHNVQRKQRRKQEGRENRRSEAWTIQEMQRQRKGEKRIPIGKTYEGWQQDKSWGLLWNIAWITISNVSIYVLNHLYSCYDWNLLKSSNS